MTFKLPEAKLSNFVILIVCFIIIFSYFYFEPDTKLSIYYANKNPIWCNRSSEIFYHEVNASPQCLQECWRLYGCEHNATGKLLDGNCLCSGGIVRQKTVLSYFTVVQYQFDERNKYCLENNITTDKCYNVTQ